MRPAKPWKPSRSERRVLLALLSGASNLSGYPISRAAQVGSGRVYIVLDRLERRLGWVQAEWEVLPPGEDRPRRRFYSLTFAGRMHVMDLLGLKDSNKGEQWTSTPSS